MGHHRSQRRKARCRASPNASRASTTVQLRPASRRQIRITNQGVTVVASSARPSTSLPSIKRSVRVLSWRSVTAPTLSGENTKALRTPRRADSTRAKARPIFTTRGNASGYSAAIANACPQSKTAASIADGRMKKVVGGCMAAAMPITPYGTPTCRWYRQNRNYFSWPRLFSSGGPYSRSNPDRIPDPARKY